MNFHLVKNLKDKETKTPNKKMCWSFSFEKTDLKVDEFWKNNNTYEILKKEREVFGFVIEQTKQEKNGIFL